MLEVRRAGAKGLGLFAKTAIQKGSRLISERPTLALLTSKTASDIFPAAALISPADRRRVLDLSSHNSSPFLRWSQVLGFTIKRLFTDLTQRTGPLIVPSVRSLKEHLEILSIFRTNSFSIGGTSNIHQAIFAKVARLNHSCVPNTQGNFHDGLGCFNVHATRDIKADEELTISYLPEHGASQSSRQKSLVDGYGFACDCPACDLTTPRGRDGESRRLAMQEELGEFARRIEETGIRSLKAELETTRSYIRLFEQEGIAGRELSTMYVKRSSKTYIAYKIGISELRRLMKRWGIRWKHWRVLSADC